MLLFSVVGGLVAFIIQAIVKTVLAIMEEIVKQIVQEILEEISGNEDLFDEMFSFDPLYRRYSLILRDAEEELGEDPTPEEVEDFARNQATAVAMNMRKEWRTEPGGSISGVCHHCNNLGGTIVKITDSFHSGNWMGMGPPRHPSCRCRIKVMF